MRGGLERWKRGVESQGVRQAIAYALKGTCDSHLRSVTGVDALADYSDIAGQEVARFMVTDGEITTDVLNEAQLRRWVDGHEPESDAARGRELRSPQADLILDGTINAPKSFSVAALINDDLAVEFEALQDRLRDRIMVTWQRELNARRGAGGKIREALSRVEVVELQHRRSRALDPHIHRHLWLNVNVLGWDGRWSNIDSRVAMKLHTVVNAEGELAARTDPAWVAALARNGFTIGDDGEITELTCAVRPLSRRSNQIEANRARLIAQWQEEHPGQQPDRDVLTHIDRQAWALQRPNKPGTLDEDEWQALVRGELEAIDPALLQPREAVSTHGPSLAALDHDLLAAMAIVDADRRSAACGGRFSMFDVRAGVMRAIAASGVTADRADLDEPIRDVVDRALALTVDLLEGEGRRPDHIKGFMAADTAKLKAELATRFDALAIGGTPASGEAIARAAAVLPGTIALDTPQRDAAAAIAGTDRLVSVTGPAGTGKTTMLKTARAALQAEGRRMVIVAPTKKAASVAGRETGAAASSLHALLADHGWRWGHGAASEEVWMRLAIGEADPTTGVVYGGPHRFVLEAGDRIVVDEAGMVDLHTANALAVLAAETDAGLAMVGDHLQAMPVGHSGAMASLTRRATAVVELTSVHRFHDPEYAALSLRLREPGSRADALEVAAELDRRGLVRRVADASDARDAMVDAFFEWSGQHKRVALVTGTNEEADAINEAIQQRRVDAGQLSLHRIAVGQGEQRLLEGDIVQTRRNDRHAGVENRALWVIGHITGEDIELESVTDERDVRRVSHDYAGEHMHLAYASTVHGIQGETTDASLVGPGVDASGLYVGMTRGRVRNEVVAIARTDTAAREQIADAMARGIPEVSIGDSIRAARTELGRAAQDPNPTSPPTVRDAPRWDDRARRPFGAEPRLERVLAKTSERLARARLLSASYSSFMGEAGPTLLRLASIIATSEARLHARGPVPSEDAVASSQQRRLAVEVDRVRERQRLLANDIALLQDLLQSLESESRIRESLPAPLRSSEPRERAMAASTTSRTAVAEAHPALDR